MSVISKPAKIKTIDITAKEKFPVFFDPKNVTYIAFKIDPNGRPGYHVGFTYNGEFRKILIPAEYVGMVTYY